MRWNCLEKLIDYTRQELTRDSMKKDFFNLVMMDGVVYSTNEGIDSYSYKYFELVCQDFKELTQDNRKVYDIIQDLFAELEGEEPIELLEQWELNKMYENNITQSN